MSTVAILYTSPETVIEDYAKLLNLAKSDEVLDNNKATFLKVNISWQHYYPACSSTPWQIEGVGKYLQSKGFSNLTAAHNGTVVVNPHEGRTKNKHNLAEEKPSVPLPI